MSGYREPTPEQVDSAVRRILTPQLRRAFFEGLKNPLWLQPLADRGVFSNPPEPETGEDGLVRDVYWPQLAYLVRVAPEVPALVVDVFLGLRESHNSWVRRAAFSVGAAVPSSEGARLLDLIKAWARSGLGWRSDPREMVSFAAKLLEGGEYSAGVWLADRLFRPRAAEGSRKPELTIEEYWYYTELPRVISALGEAGFEAVLRWLDAYEASAGRAKSGFDLTSLARDAIRERSGFAVAPSAEQSLIDGVRDLAVLAMAHQPEQTRNALLRSGTVLNRKIAMFAAAVALTSPDTAVAQRQALMTVAVDLLVADGARDESCLIEFGELARAIAHVAPAELTAVEAFLDGGPSIEAAELRRRLMSMPGQGEGGADDAVDEYLARWRHRRLAAIGVDALPDALKSELVTLDARFAPIDDPLTPPIRTRSWTGPNGAISVDDMSAMSPSELFAQLESWHDTGDHFGPAPSHEGQGRDLTALLTTAPGALEGVEGLVEHLRPTYVRAILQGWEGALRAGLPLLWDQAAEVIEQVLRAPDASPFPQEGRDFDDDPDYRWAKKAAISLLVELVKQREDDVVPADVLSTFANLLITDGDDEQAWTEYDEYQGEGGSDPLTISLNWQWPERLRGLIHLMAYGTGASWYDAALQAVERELARPDRRGASRAVVGESIGRLLNAELEWVRNAAPSLFGGSGGLSREQQIALTTTLAVYGYHPALFGLLTAPLLAALQFDGPLSVGWGGNADPRQRIGEWAIGALLSGHKAMDDPVVAAFFARSDAKLRGEALGRVAWSFVDAGEVADEVRERFAELWDARIAHVREHPEDGAELSGFFWLARSGQYPAEWWLPRLEEALELNPALGQERYMLGKAIALAARSDPRRAFSVTKALLGDAEHRGPGAWDLSHALPVVLARAIQAENEDLKKDAVEFMNLLGEEGNPDLERQVEDVLQGRVDETDVED